MDMHGQLKYCGFIQHVVPSGKRAHERLVRAVWECLLSGLLSNPFLFLQHLLVAV